MSIRTELQPVPKLAQTTREIVVEIAVNANVPSADSIRAWAETAADEAFGDICLRIVNANESRRLNAQFRHIDAPTNVLAFPADQEAMLGDAAICAEVAIAEAQAQHKPIDAYFAHLVVHAVLHLRGFDHGCVQDAARMELKEIELLRTFGMANPYE